MTQQVGGANGPIGKRGPLVRPTTPANVDNTDATPKPALPTPKPGDAVAGSLPGVGNPEGMSPFSFNGPEANVAAARARTLGDQNKTVADRDAAAKSFTDAMGQNPPNVAAAAAAAKDFMKAGPNQAKAYQQLMNQTPEAQRPALAREMLAQYASDFKAAAGLPRDVAGDLARAAVSGTPAPNMRELTAIQNNLSHITRSQEALGHGLNWPARLL